MARGDAPVGISLRRISAAFPNDRQEVVAVVKELDLEAAPGELLTLLGPSGCGKTTTLRMIAGFQEPTDGTILIGRSDVTRVPANRRNIGFVFQNYALFPHMTILENVAYGLRVQRQSESAIRSAVEEVLALVGLGGYAARLPNELSGGQQQRVALARAIVIRPRVLLLDEPLSNLDAKLRVQMREEIRRLQKTLGITTVYVTHDQEEAMAISIAARPRPSSPAFSAAPTCCAEPHPSPATGRCRSTWAVSPTPCATPRRARDGSAP
jgi:iron(III) transport system ATP-binding protein